MSPTPEQKFAASMTQSELARRVAEYGLPFHQQTIQRIEAGERPIRLNEAMAMCEVLGLSLPTAIHHEMQSSIKTARLTSDQPFSFPGPTRN